MDDTLAPAGLATRLRASLRPETRGICLNTPNNPTGTVLTLGHYAGPGAKRGQK